MARRLDHAGRVTLAGGLAGLVAIGVGSRVAMRVVALTSGHVGDLSVRPESGAVPGTMTLSGTGFLLFAGTFLGAVIGLAVLTGLGRWMPAHRRRRWWLTAVLATAVPAIGLLDPANHDFRIFGPTWLAVGLFAALPPAYGALLATWARRLLRWQGGRIAHGVRVVAGLVGLGATFMVAVASGTNGVPGLLSVPLLTVIGLAVGPTAGTGPSRIARAGRALVPILASVAVGIVSWRLAAVAFAAGTGA